MIELTGRKKVEKVRNSAVPIILTLVKLSDSKTVDSCFKHLGLMPFKWHYVVFLPYNYSFKIILTFH